MVIASLIGLPLFAQAQDKPLKKISWGVTSLSASNWIPWIAKEAKIYEKNGLDVELVLVRGSGQTSAAILGGSLFAAPVAVPQVMMALLAGADLVNIAHTVPGVQSKLLVGQEIKRPEDIKGKRIATSALGSLGDFLFKYIIRKNGMDPLRDVILALHRHAAGTASGVVIGAGGCCGPVLSYGRSGAAPGLSNSLGCQKRGGLSFDVGRDPAQDRTRGPRHGDAHAQIPYRGHRLS